MRTITEFYGRNLKTIEEKIPAITEEATKAATETLKAEGKSDEEVAAALPAAVKAAVDAKMTEQTKLEGDKLAMMLSAIEAMKGARGNLKRVIVMAPNEGEKAPAGAREIDGKFYVVEFFPEPARAESRSGRDEGRGRDGRGGKRGGKGGRGDKGRGGRGGRDGEGRGRGPRRDAPAGFVGEGASSVAPTAVNGGEGAGAGERKPRRERKPRTPIEPYVGPNRIVLKGGAPVAASVPAVPETPAPNSDGSA